MSDLHKSGILMLLLNLASYLYAGLDRSGVFRRLSQAVTL